MSKGGQGFFVLRARFFLNFFLEPHGRKIEHFFAQLRLANFLYFLAPCFKRSFRLHASNHTLSRFLCFQNSARLFSRTNNPLATCARLLWRPGSPRSVNLRQPSFCTKTWGDFFLPSGSTFRVSLPVDNPNVFTRWPKIKRSPLHRRLARQPSFNHIPFLVSLTLRADRAELSRHGACIYSVH